MALSVTHSTVVAVADDGTSPVGTNEWNAAHTLTGAASVAQGGTGLTTIAANAVPYASALDTLTANATNLSFDGTNLKVGGQGGTSPTAHDWRVSIGTDPGNTASPAIFMDSSVGGRRFFLGSNANTYYAVSFKYTSNIEECPGTGFGLGRAGTTNLQIGSDNNFCVFADSGFFITYNACVSDNGHRWFNKGGGGSFASSSYLVADLGNEPSGSSGKWRLFNVGDRNYTNWESVTINWASNVCYIKPEANGTGTVRPMVVVTPGMTVASLPAASAALTGARAFVTDANATTFASIVAGGGANKIPVYCDGTNWRIG